MPKEEVIQKKKVSTPLSPLENERLVKILLQTSYVAEEDLKEALLAAKKTRASLLDVLFTKKLLTRSVLGQAVAEALHVPFVDLIARPPLPEDVRLLPEELSKSFDAVVAASGKGGLVVASSRPEDPALSTALKKIFLKKKWTLAFALPEDIEPVRLYYRSSLETRFAKILQENPLTAAPQLFDQILSDAVSYHASDIHFEPLEKSIRIRFRVDGVLREAGDMTPTAYESLVNRIKVQAKIRIDQHQKAQDGAIRYRIDDKDVDLRVSILPTYFGEKIALRILALYVRGMTLEDLGCDPVMSDHIASISRKPYGMVIVAGPTGSGKTTTLYAVLKTLHRPEVNITTIEDPVEYRIPGVNQIQVNEATELTFANGLRSIVRQDPDIILVGEIRDQETAEIAVNAALTGHLLLSTFHANDAATTIPRLLDMGIEAFLLASTLDVILAQRLARTICDACKTRATYTQKDIDRIAGGAASWFTGDAYYIGKGCTVCHGTGFKGRTALFEEIIVTKEMQDLIVKHPSSAEIWQLAQQQGTRSLFEDGIIKVHEGMISMEELLRVANPPKEETRKNIA